MNSWNTITMGELIDNGEASLQTGPFGTQFKASEYVESGIPMLNVKNIGFGDIRTGSLDYLDEKTAYRLRVHRLKLGDIVFGRKGSADRHALVGPNSVGWIQGSDCMRLRLTSGRVTPHFLSYYFCTSGHKYWMEALCAFGATMSTLNQGIVRRISLRVPGVEIQEKLISILSAYDEVIEINRKRIEYLEKLAEEIYCEWFVRLRFPGHEKFELENRALRSFISEYIGGDWGEDIQNLKYGNPVYVIRGTDFGGIQQGDISSVPLRFIKDSALKNRKLKVGDLIVENSVNHQSRTSGKSLLITKHVLDLFTGDVICASFCKLIRPKDIKHSKYLALNLRLLFDQGLFDYFQNIATNGIANLQAERLMDRNLIPFHEKLDLSIFDSLDTSLLARTQAKLKETRDKLLPRLLSGKLSVENLDIQSPPSIAKTLNSEYPTTAYA